MEKAHSNKKTEGAVVHSITDVAEHGKTLRTDVQIGSNGIFPLEREIDSTTRTVSPGRPARLHAPDFTIHRKEESNQVTGGEVSQSSKEAAGSPRGNVTQGELQKMCALDNAPPPIKIHPQTEDTDSSTEELSPPPSPKRKKDLLEKDNVISRPFSPIAAFQHDLEFM
ncbi:hypothetical protein R1sor_022168 [Riccia sorocarpa]|uniref:Uncharacterized protein n=1 Tax=Riccia sorocarpa TaxID=122646 RepID=A0ABD3GL12_9MARC